MSVDSENSIQRCCNCNARLFFNNNDKEYNSCGTCEEDDEFVDSQKEHSVKLPDLDFLNQNFSNIQLRRSEYVHSIANNGTNPMMTDKSSIFSQESTEEESNDSYFDQTQSSDEYVNEIIKDIQGVSSVKKVKLGGITEVRLYYPDEQISLNMNTVNSKCIQYSNDAIIQLNESYSEDSSKLIKHKINNKLQREMKLLNSLTYSEPILLYSNTPNSNDQLMTNFFEDDFGDFSKEDLVYNNSRNLSNNNEYLRKNEILKTNNLVKSENKTPSQQLNKCIEFSVNFLIEYLKERPHLTLYEVRDFIHFLCEETTKIENNYKRINEFIGDEDVKNVEKSSLSKNNKSQENGVVNKENSLVPLNSNNDYDMEMKFKSKVSNLESSKFSKSPPKFDCPEQVNPDPFVCPIETCKNIIFVSQFLEHVEFSHSEVQIKIIQSGKYEKLFLNPKISQFEMKKCQYVLLISNKINKGRVVDGYEDYLPVLLMSAKIEGVNLMNLKRMKTVTDLRKYKEDLLVFWLIGLRPIELRLNYRFIIPSNHPYPKYDLIHEGVVYSIYKNQNLKNLYESSNAILLSKDHCDLMTNDGKNELEIHIAFQKSKNI